MYWYCMLQYGTLNIHVLYVDLKDGSQVLMNLHISYCLFITLYIFVLESFMTWYIRPKVGDLSGCTDTCPVFHDLVHSSQGGRPL